MKHFAYIKNGTVFLDTGRSEEAFGKSNLAVSLNRDAGFFVKFMAQDEAVSNHGSGEKIECFPWKFSQIQSDADGTVVLSGKLNESACLDNGFEEAELSAFIPDCAPGEIPWKKINSFAESFSITGSFTSAASFASTLS